MKRYPRANSTADAPDVKKTCAAWHRIACDPTSVLHKIPLTLSWTRNDNTRSFPLPAPLQDIATHTLKLPLLPQPLGGGAPLLDRVLAGVASDGVDFPMDRGPWGCHTGMTGLARTRGAPNAMRPAQRAGRVFRPRRLRRRRKIAPRLQPIDRHRSKIIAY